MHNEFQRPLSRREILKTFGVFSASVIAGSSRLAFADPSKSAIALPFDNGSRQLVTYPEKRPLLLLTSRPPQLETPFAVFNESLLTPRDAFFVRYHLSGIPTSIDTKTFRLKIDGLVMNSLSFSLDELKKMKGIVSMVAVNQCSGNSRGFSTPRVGGGQLGNGAMGNARWTGIPLRTLLRRAGVKYGAREVVFDGLDRPVLPQTPDFVKSLPLEHSMESDVLVAWDMNNEPLPHLNGFPLRLVVPGYYGTYWVKHLTSIRVTDGNYDGFWMAKAYRIPANDCGCVQPGEVPEKTVPISKMVVRSFLTNAKDGDVLPLGKSTTLRGIAFSGGDGIKLVDVSTDEGQHWQSAKLGESYGRFAFREWKYHFTPQRPGPLGIMVRATSGAGDVQPLEALWNPSGYRRNNIEKVGVIVA